ncbi:hypothetical protein Ahia01_000117100, partial [Argonauta hians]
MLGTNKSSEMKKGEEGMKVRTGSGRRVQEKGGSVARVAGRGSAVDGKGDYSRKQTLVQKDKVQQHHLQQQLEKPQQQPQKQEIEHKMQQQKKSQQQQQQKQEHLQEQQRTEQQMHQQLQHRKQQQQLQQKQQHQLQKHYKLQLQQQPKQYQKPHVQQEKQQQRYLELQSYAIDPEKKLVLPRPLNSNNNRQKADEDNLYNDKEVEVNKTEEVTDQNCSHHNARMEDSNNSDSNQLQSSNLRNHAMSVTDKFHKKVSEMPNDSEKREHEKKEEGDKKERERGKKVENKEAREIEELENKEDRKSKRKKVDKIDVQGKIIGEMLMTSQNNDANDNGSGNSNSCKTMSFKRESKEGNSWRMRYDKMEESYAKGGGKSDPRYWYNDDSGEERESMSELKRERVGERERGREGGDNTIQRCAAGDNLTALTLQNHSKLLVTAASTASTTAAACATSRAVEKDKHLQTIVVASKIITTSSTGINSTTDITNTTKSETATKTTNTTNETPVSSITSTNTNKGTFATATTSTVITLTSNTSTVAKTIHPITVRNRQSLPSISATTNAVESALSAATEIGPEGSAAIVNTQTKPLLITKALLPQSSSERAFNTINNQQEAKAPLALTETLNPLQKFTLSKFSTSSTSTKTITCASSIDTTPATSIFNPPKINTVTPDTSTTTTDSALTGSPVITTSASFLSPPSRSHNLSLTQNPCSKTVHSNQEGKEYPSLNRSQRQSTEFGSETEVGTTKVQDSEDQNSSQPLLIIHCETKPRLPGIKTELSANDAREDKEITHTPDQDKIEHRQPLYDQHNENELHYFLKDVSTSNINKFEDILDLERNDFDESESLKQ